MDKFEIKTIVPLMFVWLWSTGFIGAKYALPYIDPFLLLSVRSFFSAIIIALIIVFFKRKYKLTTKQILDQLLNGFLMHVCYLGGVFYAVNLGMDAGFVSIIVSLQPILTALFALIVLNNKITKRHTIGLIIGFIGAVLVIAGSNTLQSQSIISYGLISVLLALFTISAGTIYQKKIGNNTPLLIGVFWQYISAFVLFTIMSFALENQYYKLEISLILAFLWLVFALSLGAVLLLMYMIDKGEVSKITSYFYLVPPVTVFQAWLLFDEQLNLVSLFGLSFIITGIYLVIKVKKEKK